MKKVKTFFNKLGDKILEKPLAYSVALVVVSLVIVLLTNSGEVKAFAIVTLGLMACIFFGPVLVFGGWFIVLIAQSGASPYVIIVLILLCLYLDSFLAQYGVLGGLIAWWFFRR